MEAQLRETVQKRVDAMFKNLSGKLNLCVADETQSWFFENLCRGIVESQREILEAALVHEIGDMFSELEKDLYISIDKQKKKVLGDDLKDRILKAFDKNKQKEKIEHTVISTIDERFGHWLDINWWKPAARDIELMDVGWDSLEMQDYLQQLEQEFKIDIPDNEAKRLKTIGDVYDCITNKLVSKGWSETKDDDEILNVTPG